MIPLSPPANYWDKFNFMISQFIWNEKRPRLKHSIVHRGVDSGGLAGPNFKLYFWLFVLRPLLAWNDAEAVVSWCKLEENCVRPWSLQEAKKTLAHSFQILSRYGVQLSAMAESYTTL